PEQADVVGGGALAPPEDRHDQRQADHDLGRRHHQGEEHEDLPADVVEHTGEGDEGQVHGVEHQFDAHEHDQGVAPDEQADGADAEDDGGEGQVPGAGNVHCSCSPGGSGASPGINTASGPASLPPPTRSSSSRIRPGPLRRARTMAPTTAITSSAEVISKGQRKSVNRPRASRSTLGTSPWVSEPRTDGAPVGWRILATRSSPANNATPAATATGRCPRNGSSRTSSRSMPSSMITNRNKMTIAPA